MTKAKLEESDTIETMLQVLKTERTEKTEEVEVEEDKDHKVLQLLMPQQKLNLKLQQLNNDFVPSLRFITLYTFYKVIKLQSLVNIE